jgi:hypothetical protein
MVAPLALVLCAGLACHHAPPPGRDPVSSRGSFDFVAFMDRSEVHGRFIIGGKVVVFEASDGSCRPTSEAEASDPTIAARYLCEGTKGFQRVVYTISLRDPTRASTWRTTIMTRQRKDVCEQYTPRGARQVCVRWRAEWVDTEVPLSGHLVVVRHDSTAPRYNRQPRAGSTAGRNMDGVPTLARDGSARHAVGGDRPPGDRRP